LGDGRRRDAPPARRANTSMRDLSGSKTKNA
jgi:hypothetical protein